MTTDLHCLSISPLTHPALRERALAHIRTSVRTQTEVQGNIVWIRAPKNIVAGLDKFIDGLYHAQQLLLRDE